MYRRAIEKLVKWKDSPLRKPLLIQGARQVGKTWLMREFGRKHFAKVAYIHFDNNRRMQSIFEEDYDLRRIISILQIESGIRITPQDTLIIFDEIQAAPRALNCLKYFYENCPEYAIIAAGSLLGVSLHYGESFPVGKVDFLDLYPLSYLEFLMATGNEQLAELISSRDWQLITLYKNKLIEQLRLYYYIGGMPEAISVYLRTNDLRTVRQAQLELLRAYERDFSKHAPLEQVPRIEMICRAIPGQLAKENRRFIYGALRSGAKAREFELAMQWLLGAGLIYHVARVSKPSIPLTSYLAEGFKVYTLDIGLLCAQVRLGAKTLLDGNSIFQEFKGALTEQFVQQELRATCGITPQYWSRENGTAEIDFLYEAESSVVPIEVKAEENLQAKSLSVYCQKFHPKYAIRTSMADYRVSERDNDGSQCSMITLPLYAINQIRAECHDDSVQLGI